jgi:hypothetical protein
MLQLEEKGSHNDTSGSHDPQNSSTSAFTDLEFVQINTYTSQSKPMRFFA